MKSACAAIVFIFAAAPALAAASRSRGATRSPKVEKVVELLKELQESLEADEKKEQQTYDKYACWCETITHKKATAITDAKDLMRVLGQSILSLKGKVATLTSEIEGLLADMEENEKAQKTATEIRSKENAAWQAETAELKETMVALEKCITVLTAATMPMGEPMPEALLQQTSKAKLAGQHLKDTLVAAPVGSLSQIAPSRLSLLRSYAEQLSQGKAGYTPQSLTIQGILKEMYATFAEDLESKMEDESSKNTLFEALIATKQKEMMDMEKSVKKKTAEKAEAEVMLAEATQSYDDTEAQLNHDIEFFDATKESCTTTAGDWSDRQALREEELAGVKKAIEILDNDDARTLFDDAIQEGHQGGHAASFLQVASDDGAPARLAFGALKAKASSSGSLRLARVAVRVAQAKAGHFDAVIADIDQMIHDIDITEEQEDEKKIDQCKNEYAKSNGTMADLNWKISKNDAKIEKLTTLIEDLTKERDEALATIDETETMVEGMNATRDQENKDFLAAKDNDLDAIALLEEARDALSSYYENQSVEGMEVVTAGGEGKTMLLQEEPEFAVSEEQAPEAKFSGKGKRKGQAKGILAIMTDIIEDLKGEIGLGKKQEEAAQLEHEKQVAAAHALIASLEEKCVNLKTDIENKEEAKLQEEEDKDTNEKDLKTEQDYLKSITPDCDWIIDNAPERRAKRRAELDGLTAAKAYLVGYKENAELGQGVAANQAGLLQGAKKSAHTGHGTRNQEHARSRYAATATAEAVLGNLKQRERALKAMAKKEEVALEKHQGSISQAALATKSRSSARAHRQAATSYDQLRKKEKMLQSMFEKEEQQFESRQPHHKQAKKGALLQEQTHASQAMIDRLDRKEKALQRFAKQEEADFDERQRHYHPLVRGSAMLQQQFGHTSQVKDTSDQLLHKLGRLQSMEKQMEQDLYSRQPVHTPHMAPRSSRIQETQDQLNRRLKRLRTQAKEEHEAFLQSSKSQ